LARSTWFYEPLGESAENLARPGLGDFLT
jgi:hypothetical protein